MSEPLTERRYIAALTGLRGVAAGMVFLFHYAALHPGIRLDLAVPVLGPALQFPFGLGFVGVDIFFVLSGFLISLPFAAAAQGAEQFPPLRRYIRRRLLRVFPAYYAQLFLLLLVGAWFVTWRPLGPEDLLAHFFMFFNIGWEPVRPMVGVWWTLPVEMGFYLLLPILAVAMRPTRWIPLLVLCIIGGAVYRGWAAAHFGPLGSHYAFLVATQLPGNLGEFLLGASAALLASYVEAHELRRPPPWALDLLFGAGLIIPATWLWQIVLPVGEGYWLGHWSMKIAPLAMGLPLSLAVLGIYWGSRVGAFLLANRGVYALGLVSYSLYLWHFVVMQQLQQLIGPAYANLPHTLTFTLTCGSALIVATASYYVAERPFFRLKPWRLALGSRSQPGK